MVLPKTLNPAYDKDLPPLGRPLQGELRQCRDCGTDIYVRRYRLNPKGNMCWVCRNKHLRDYARLPRKRWGIKEINKTVKNSRVGESTIRPILTKLLSDEEQARRCIKCSSLKSRAGVFRCTRQNCQYD